MPSNISSTEISRRIAEARGRISAPVIPTAPASVAPPPSNLAVKRHYSESYSQGDIDWLPQRAEIEIDLPADANGVRLSGSHELTVTLSSGPEALYKYFPFAAYVYVDDALCAIGQFAREWQTQELRVVVPSDRPSVLTIITELSDFRPLFGLTEEKRQVALILADLALGARAEPPALKHAVSPRAAEDHFSQLRTALTPDLAAPVFVIGAYRSATSILTWAIGQHPNLWPLEETGWLHLFGLGAIASHRLASEAKRSFFDVYDVSAQEFFAHVGSSIDQMLRATSLRHFDRINLQRLAGKTDVGFDRFDERFQLARSLFDTKRRWVDGTPENAENILLLKMLFPLARFVCTLRHPFDVLASMAHFGRAGGTPMSIDEAADMWLQKVEGYTLAACALGPTVVRVVSYDQLVRYPADALQDVFDFIGEPRFPNAADTFQARINSSRVNDEERQRIREAVSTSPRADALLRTYDAAMALVSGRWEQNSQAFAELAARQNDIVTRLIAQVV